ncbi:Endo-1,4-beta-xylanase/feruloyl esterase precursor [Paenibacillus konkukensis]|uniref:Endo-1,4-beta-xylanase/feruloyl esterase n=1 Tax=Paenibacillus konkukensis TaxID=2020716 RepID=A0ABY4RY27_9BACL|nr:alpha/beta hydrolase-fold protein [Paenibacillus konkukensis]UQZ87571.1 Endo-1,4-beta-xylanase/feruloyl esterase precursor [Paenibacillus konkukensis]
MKGLLKNELWDNRELTIYVPPTYGSKPDRAYPVVYVHDGGNLFDPKYSESLTVLERQFASGELRELILVGIRPLQRLDEYTPWPAQALSAKFADFGGRGSEYADLIVRKLIPYIRERYAVLEGPEHTAMAGASLGGLISMYAAYLHPDRFGRIGSISGSYWYPGFVDYMRAHSLEDRAYRRIYMDVGSIEGKQMYPLNRQVHALLRQMGHDDDRLRFDVEEGAAHDPSLFPMRLPKALQWLFADRTGKDKKIR